MVTLSFTEHEALSKVGKNIKLKSSYVGMPKHTIATVIDIKNEDSQWMIVIKWCRPEKKITKRVTGTEEVLVDAITTKPLVDWFDRDEFYKYFEEL